MDFPGGSDGKESACNAGDLGLIFWGFVFNIIKIYDIESPLDCKEIQPVHSEGDQPWDFFGRTDAEAETPVLWPPHGKS